MNKAKKILAPTDLSELSQAGVRYALEMARAEGAELLIYHVVGPEEATPYFYEVGSDEYPSAVEYRPVSEIVEERRRVLAKFLRENFGDVVPNVKIRQEVEVGGPYRKIVEKAVKEGADLIVMSTHGRTGLLHLLIGSVTEKVVRHAACPVLSVRPKETRKLAQAAVG